MHFSSPGLAISKEMGQDENTLLIGKVKKRGPRVSEIHWDQNP